MLYIDGVGVYGGACRSLYENVKHLNHKHVDPYFIIQKGSVLKYYTSVSKNIISVLGISRFDNTEFSHYRGLRWLILLRELFFIPFTIYAFVRARVAWKNFDVIHINELTEVFPIILSKLFFSAPIVVHCRSLYNNDPKSLRNKLIKSIIKNNVSCLIAIDQNVYETIPKVVNTVIINNSFSPISASKDEHLNQSSNSLTVGYVGTLSKMKGIYELIDCYKLLKNEKLNIFLLVAGDIPKKYNAYSELILTKLGLINQNSLKDFNSLIKSLGIEDKVTFLGHVNEISTFYHKIDIVCFPSFLDAPGRPVIEAAYYGKPSIVTVKKPHNDTLINGVTGIAIPNNDPLVIKSTLIELHNNFKKMKLMGEAAKELYEKNFNVEKNSNKLLTLYNNVQF